ncbi:MAG TPA: periplasmic heavy metal sensor [bacterium]|nr:periplasmic heavy metal sensor [bacterium]
MKRIGLLSLAAVMAVGAATGFSQQHRGMRYDPEKLQEKLGLTDEQAAQIREVEHRYALAAVDTGAAIAKARLEFRDEMSSATPDLEKCRRLAGVISSAQADQSRAQLEKQVTIRSMLTPDQWKQYMKLNRPSRRGARGSGEGRGPGGMAGRMSGGGMGGEGCRAAAPVEE